MKKIILKVSTIYGIYKQTLYIFFLFLFVFISFYFLKEDNILSKYPNISKLLPLVFGSLSVIFLLRIIYGVMYHKLIGIELYEDRIILRKGVFSRKRDYLELYRVKDFNEYQSFFMRIFKIMNVTLETSDKSDPLLHLYGIPKSNILDIIRDLTEKQRKIKGVREFD